MPDAWTILKSNSTIPSGDAWEHLNAQGGGGSITVYWNPLIANIMSTVSATILSSVSAAVSASPLTANVGETLSATVHNQTLTAGI